MAQRPHQKPIEQLHEEFKRILFWAVLLLARPTCEKQ